MKKFNLLLNSSFKTFDFHEKIEDSIYANSTENMFSYSVGIVLESKPNSNDVFAELAVGNTLTCYLFPLSSNNYAFNVGDLLYLHDNMAIFVVMSHVLDNKFIIKLINITDGSPTYQLKNTSMAVLYNSNFEKFAVNLNDIKEYITNQKSEYTEYINDNNSFVTYLLEKMVITDTDSTIGMTFNFTPDLDNALFNNVINKFYLNILTFDYNDFKYIYSNDIKSGLSNSNSVLASSKLIAGVLKSLQTKIIPHFSTKLISGNTYTFNTDIVNKHTKYTKSYNNNKLIILVQLTLNDKSTVYDQANNIESDYMYIIW